MRNLFLAIIVIGSISAHASADRVSFQQAIDIFKKSYGVDVDKGEFALGLCSIQYDFKSDVNSGSGQLSLLVIDRATPRYLTYRIDFRSAIVAPIDFNF